VLGTLPYLMLTQAQVQPVYVLECDETGRTKSGDSPSVLWSLTCRWAIFRHRAGKDFTPKQEVRANEETISMRRFFLIAAAAAIALVGLSANQCGGGGEKAAEPAKPAEEMPAKPDDSMSSDTPAQ